MRVELFLLIATTALFMCLFILLVHWLGPQFSVLEWIISISALVFILALQVMTIVEKLIALDDQVHYYKTRQKLREWELHQHIRKLTPPHRRGP